MGGEVEAGEVEAGEVEAESLHDDIVGLAFVRHITNVSKRVENVLISNKNSNRIFLGGDGKFH